MIKRFFILFATLSVMVFAASNKNIDSGSVSVSIYNNKPNILNFPFIVKKADLVTDEAEMFLVKVTGNTVTVTPVADSTLQKASIIVRSRDGYSYIVNLRLSSKRKSQVWNLTSGRVQMNNSKAISFETGKIDQDMKRLIKTAVLKGNIPGFKKIKTKVVFQTPDITMQKDTVFDGPKYRVELWYYKNKTSKDIILDEESIYTNGLLCISPETRRLPANKIVTMYFVVNKASLQASK